MNVVPETTSGRWRSFLDLMRAAWTEYELDYARYFAGAMVYHTLIALVPFVLLILATLGLLLRWSEHAGAIQQQLLLAVESSFGEQLKIALGTLLQRLEEGSLVASVVSLVGMLLTASVLFRHLRMTFRAIWKQTPLLISGSIRSSMQATLFERVIAFAMVLAGGALLVGAFVVIGIFHWLVARFGDLSLVGRTLGWTLSLLSPLFVAPLTFGLLFTFLPPLPLTWRYIWLATLLSSIAWVLGAEALALYTAYFSHNLSAYGAVGGVLMFMLWIHVLSKVLFFGGELCKVIQRRDMAGHIQ
jgi:membrane protein